jgi:hypothetical protein
VHNPLPARRRPLAAGVAVAIAVIIAVLAITGLLPAKRLAALTPMIRRLMSGVH